MFDKCKAMLRYGSSSQQPAVAAASSEVGMQTMTLEEWVSNQKEKYGSRNGLRDSMRTRAAKFDREGKGLSGELLDNLLSTDPVFVPIEFWGGDLGWRSDKRRSAWKKLVGEEAIASLPHWHGILLKCEFDPTNILPHPYAPPFSLVANQNLFRSYIFDSEAAFHMCRQWQQENNQRLTAALKSRWAKLDVYVVAKYKCHDKTDYAEIALLLPKTANLLRIKTVWKSETELFQLVCRFFPDTVREYNAPWLGDQRLDMYIPSIKLGIEYQGEQHYKPVEYFGGKKGLAEVKLRDEKKRQACRKAGVRLLEWEYTTQVSKHCLDQALAALGVILPEQ